MRPLTIFLFVLRIREPLSTTDTVNAGFGAVFLLSNAIESTVTFWTLLDFRCPLFHQHQSESDEKQVCGATGLNEPGRGAHVERNGWLTEGNGFALLYYSALAAIILTGAMGALAQCD